MTSETLVNIYQTTQRNNPEDSNLQGSRSLFPGPKPAIQSRQVLEGSWL